jgi:hypothetical protein
MCLEKGEVNEILLITIPTWVYSYLASTPSAPHHGEICNPWSESDPCSP